MLIYIILIYLLKLSSCLCFILGNLNIDLSKGYDYLYPNSGKDEPDIKFTVPEMIRYRGFISETHEVITKDCYILQLHRIVNPKLTNQIKKPILLQHCLLGSSADFLMNSIGGRIDDKDNRNLGFYLAKLGYDVWLANSRGNAYSTNHTTLNPDKNKSFWKFSFDEMAFFDLPATIAYIKNYTKFGNIGYIGHSQGTLILFQLLSIRPEFEKIIKPIILLAPVARFSNIRTPIKHLAEDQELMKTFHQNYHSYLNLKSVQPNVLSNIFCSKRLESFCTNTLFLLGGADAAQMNNTRLQVYASNYPAGTSTWNILHYGQLVRDKRAQWFNYESREKNLKCYGREQPPEIALSKIRSPYLNLVYSENDWIADLEDVKYLSSKLKVKFNKHKIPFPQWNHFDFLVGIEADKYVNDLVVKMLLNYEKMNSNPPSINPFSDSIKLTIYNSRSCSMSSSKCHFFS